MEARQEAPKGIRWIINKLFGHYYRDWVYTNKVIKYTLEHGKHLDHTDTYYIEKFTDDVMLGVEK